MSVESVSDFLKLAKKDAAIFERVSQAVKQQEPLQAIVNIAIETGFQFTSEELQSTLNGELGERELEAVAGGTLSAPGEWFAEVRAEWFAAAPGIQIKKG